MRCRFVQIGHQNERDLIENDSAFSTLACEFLGQSSCLGTQDFHSEMLKKFKRDIGLNHKTFACKSTLAFTTESVLLIRYVIEVNGTNPKIRLHTFRVNYQIN